jgi:hypothetical protein
MASGCARYAKVKNPDPVADLRTAVSVVRVMRIFRGPNAESRLVVDLRVLAPRDRIVQLDSEPVLFMPQRGSWGRPLRGRIERTVPASARRGPGAEVAPGQTARILADVPVPDERMEPGREHRVQVTWRTRAAGGGDMRAEISRWYELRIVRVNYAAVAGLGLVLAGTLFAIGGN